MIDYLKEYNGKLTALEREKIKAKRRALRLYAKGNYNALVTKLQNDMKIYDLKIKEYKSEINNIKIPENRWEDYNSSDEGATFANVGLHSMIDVALGSFGGYAVYKAIFGPPDDFQAFLLSFHLLAIGLILTSLDSWAFRTRPLAKAIVALRKNIKQKKLDKYITKHTSKQALQESLIALNSEKSIEEELNR